MKIPSSDWSDQFEHYVIEEESDNDLDDLEPDFSEYLWMENEEEFDKTVSNFYALIAYVDKQIAAEKYYVFR